jgi:hypothetical protein
MGTNVNWSSGLPIERESLITEKPDEPFWAENLLFTLYDPHCDIGFWLHLGTVPTEWTMWEDKIFAMLPGDDGVLSMTGYHKPTPERRPGASCLRFECLEPYRRWRVQFDGMCLHTSNADMASGRAQDGRRQRLSIDVEVECATPVWDAHLAANEKTGRGAMREQGWAKEHYEQLVRARGTVRTEAGEFAYDGTGWRDHSRGPRGGGTGAAWGGHVIQGCVFPSGKGLGFSRYWTPEGEISLEGGYIVDAAGQLEHVEVIEGPRLEKLEMGGEKMPIHLLTSKGDLRLECTTRRSLWTAMAHELAVGVDLENEGLVYALNFGEVEWDGESGWLYSERSDMLNALAPELHMEEE